MAKCFCGCGDRARGMGPRGANKMGEKTLAVSDKLRDAITHLREHAQEHVASGGDPGAMLAGLEDLLDAGAHYESFWAFYAHGNAMPSTSAFVEERREWYEWTKSVTQMAAIARLTPEQLRVFTGRAPLAGAQS